MKIKALFEKYKYTLLILLLGAGLMLIPGKSEKPKTEPAPDTAQLEARLEQLLSRVEGAGEVEVLLTFSEGISYEYQVDTHTRTEETNTELEQATVLISNGSGEAPLAVRTIYPVYQGAVILCQGADRASVRLDVVNAVSDVTGLGSDKISVIKMK